MRRTRQALLGALTGILAGVVSWVVARPVLEPGLVGFAVVLNTVMWAMAVGLYAFVYEQLDRPAGREDWERQRKSALLGGIAGLVASTAVTGSMGLVAGLLSFRLGAVVGLFVFGVVLANMAVGMLAVVWRFDGDSVADGPGDVADPTD